MTGTFTISPDRISDAALHEWYEQLPPEQKTKLPTCPTCGECPFSDAICDYFATWQCDETCQYWPYGDEGRAR